MTQVPVTISTRGSVAVVNVDDGAGNMVTVGLANSLVNAFRTIEEHAGAVVLAGRPGCYSVGMDYQTLRSHSDDARELLHRATEMLLLFVEFRRPLVTACTGTALGMSAVSLLCCDVRVGSAGDYRIGMDFVSMGVPVPDLAVDLARVRLSPRHMTRACNTAQMYSPDEAVDAGFLDYVTTGDAVERACEVAAGLAERLDPKAFEVTRKATSRSLTDAIMPTAGRLWRMGRPARPTR